MDSNENKCIKREEEYNVENLHIIQKNTKANDLIYKSLPRNILNKVSSYISANDVWRTMEAYYENENIELTLMAIEESKSDEEVIRIMTMSYLEAEDERNKKSISNLKDIIHVMSKKS